MLPPFTIAHHIYHDPFVRPPRYIVGKGRGAVRSIFRNANNDYSDAIRSGEGAEMGYLPMMEKQ